MATQNVLFVAPSGLSLASAKLCPVGSDAVQETVLTPAENTNRKTIYSAAFTDAPSGDYWLIPFYGLTPLGPQRVTLLLATGTYATEDLSIAVGVSAALQSVGVTVSVVSPFATDGELLTIVKGADHLNADSGAAVITLTGTLPSYSSATPLLRCNVGSTTEEFAGTVVTPTGSTRVVRFDLPTAQTSELNAGLGFYEVQVTLSGGSITIPIPMPEEPFFNLRVKGTLA